MLGQVRWFRQGALIAALGIAWPVSQGRAQEPPADHRLQPERPTPPTAVELSDQGLMLYRKGDYAAAADRFKAAYELCHRPLLLYDIGQSYRRLGLCVEAAAAYRRYLEEDASSALAAKVNQQLSSLSGCLADAAEKEHPQRNTHAPDASPETKLPMHEGQKREGTDTPAIIDLHATPPPAVALEATLKHSTDHVTSEGPRPPRPARPFYRTWWFWTAVGGVVAVGVVTSAATILSHYDDAPCGARRCQ